MTQKHAEALAEIEAERAVLDEDFAKFEQAAAENSFSGKLRQAIHRGPLPLSTLIQRAQLDKASLIAFLRGDAPLDSDSIDRVVRELQLSLGPVEAQP